VGAKRKRYEPRAQQCTANARTGERCNNHALRGTTVCRMHGGVLPNVKKAAASTVAKHVADAKIAEFLATTEIKPVENPLEALRELAGEIITVKDWLRGQVTDLSHQSAVQGDQISAIMQLYSNFLDKAERILVNIGKLNIDERLSKIEAHQAQVMAQVMGEVILRMLQDKVKQQEAKVITGQLLAKYDR
jgi:hypothetical protein